MLKCTLVAAELWAKTGNKPDQWHCLPCHLVDVGETAGALWDRLPQPVRDLVASWLGSSDSEAKALCQFFAATHDIGKANPYFQAKAPDHLGRLAHWNLRATAEPMPHGQATNAYLNDWLQNRWQWLESEAAPVSSAIGGHHGVFLPDNKLSWLGLNEGQWHAAAFQLLDLLAELYQPAHNRVEGTNLGPFIGWLSGFITVADWLGSHEQMVAFTKSVSDWSDYASRARAKAVSLLDAIEFVAATPSDPLRLECFLPAGAEPNAMQRLAQTIAKDGFTLAVVEAPTGEGKTEAALALAEAGRAEGRGIYFAMPTMATANGLAPRIEGYIEQIGGNHATVRLLHSQAWLYKTPAHIVDNPNEYDSGCNAEDWFAGSKRGLLSRFGVGTVDQALTGAILVRHFFVRLFALAGKVVVIDEVHAYDVYMSNLMDVMLAWLRVLGCRVILLSATLPPARRKQLLSSWGVGGLIAAEYPAITWVREDGSQASESFEASARKALRIRVDADSEPLGVGQTLVEQLAERGGCGAVVVNTVNRAQELYRQLEPECAGCGVDLMIFHARYTAEDRQRIESEVLERFGKHSDRSRPTLLIATQVVEQSLDLDFDYMASELAPIDLLIQRAGRLHRHRRDTWGRLLKGAAPDERPEPELCVMCGELDENGLPKLGTTVYSGAVLAATYMALGGQRVIARPQDVAALVEEVYARVERAADEPAREPLLSGYLAKDEEDQNAAKQEAKRVSIVCPDDRHTIAMGRNRFEEDDDGPKNDRMARTRLETLPSISLVIGSPDRAIPVAPLAGDEKRDLVMRTVRVTAGCAIIGKLAGLPQGEGWHRVKALRECRLAELDGAGSFCLDENTFHYNPKLGFHWTTNNA